MTETHPIGTGERQSIVDWLRHRADMCFPLPSRLMPFRRLRVRSMAATFSATATLVERGIHEAQSLKDETTVIKAALSTLRKDEDER